MHGYLRVNHLEFPVTRKITQAVESYGFTEVTAFVDRRWFLGSFKAAIGFKQVGCSPPSLFWTDTRRRFHRRFMTKKQLSVMEEFKDLILTKREMLKRLGYSRIWDCGKLKMRWTAE